MYKYSPSQLAFYHDSVHSIIPTDAVDITAAEHAALLTGQSQGLVIQVAGDGRPALAVPEPAPPVVPASITKVQLLIGLVKRQWITAAEGRAWRGGVLPTPVVNLIAGLPEEDQFDAETRAISGTSVPRQDQIAVQLGATVGVTEAEMDEFFIFCAAL